MRSTFFHVAWLAAVATALPSPGQPSTVAPMIGVSTPSKVAQIAPEQPGKIVAVPVAAGARVAAGDVLFRLSATLEQLEADRLRDLAESDVGERRAQASLHHAERQAQRVRDLRQSDAASERDLQDQLHEVELASLRLEQARLERAQARSAAAQAAERLAQRTVRSPFAGIVTDVLKGEGSAVEKFVPVIEVMSLDPLWIEFDCPVTEQAQFQVGSEVVVAPAVRPEERRVAKILFASARASASSHTFKVRAAVDNADFAWKAELKMLVTRPGAPDNQSTPGK